MASPYHEGETAVQARAGVLEHAARLGGIVHPMISAHGQAFLLEQRFAVVASAEAEGRVWASLVVGDPSVLSAPDPQTLRIAALPVAGDPLLAVLASAREPGSPLSVGVLVIDLGTRKRLRVNGLAEYAPDTGLLVHVRQAYWNCPKYIQRRRIDPRPERSGLSAPPGASPQRSAVVSDAQRAAIGRADTFFIASAQPGGSADASHRGGEPGFVRLERDAAGRDTLLFPDYSGNGMFNTLGNLAVNPAAGLLFLDFETGGTLQLTGVAEVLWDPDQYGRWPGAERAVRFRVDEALELRGARPMRWDLVERSPFNPPPSSTASGM